MQINQLKFLFLSLAILLFSQTQIFSQVGLDMPNQVREIKIVSLKVEGNQTVDAERIKSALQLQEGNSYLPPVLRDKVRQSIKSLYEMKYFKTISVDINYPEAVDGVELVFNVKELPSLGRISIVGNEEIEESDLVKEMSLYEGQTYSASDIQREKQTILDIYHEEGFFLAEVNVTEKKDPNTERIDVTFNITENRKVKIREISFVGNKEIKGKKLRKTMKTKKKSWFFGIGGEFKEDELLGSKDSIVNYYQQNGFLDAQVVDHRLSFSPDNKYMDIEIEVSEGVQYHLGKVNFIHNDIVDERALYQQMLLKEGDVVDIQKFMMSKYQVETLFRDIGHLFVQVEEKKSYKDSVLNVTYTVHEGGLAHVNKVHVRGNTKTKDKVIRRELKIFPGDLFSQSLVMRSTREVMQLNYFDGVNPNYEPVGNDNVDLVFEVKEKEAGTGTFSAGMAYSQRDALVGTLGLQIPNFLGNGQRADLNLEWGARKQLYSIGFTEPWFLDTPTLLGGSLFWSKTENFNYIPEDNNGIIDPYGSKYFTRYGFKVRLGRRLTWPDDYFTIYTSYNLTDNQNGRLNDPSLLLQESGLESSWSINIVRDDKNLPMFPSDGSRYSFTWEKFGGPLGGDFDYAKWETKINWWFPTIEKLVLGIETELGIITGDKIQKWDLYQMGGILGFNGKLRGYDNGVIGQGKIGRSFFSFVTQLVYPVAPNVFYLHSFFDMGNVYGKALQNPSPTRGALGSPIDDIDLSDLLKDYGLGFRLVIPMVGIMGFDFAWNLGPDKLDGRKVSNDGIQTNFVIEAPF